MRLAMFDGLVAGGLALFSATTIYFAYHAGRRLGGFWLAATCALAAALWAANETPAPHERGMMAEARAALGIGLSAVTPVWER